MADWFIDKALPPIVSGLVIAIFASWIVARALERFRGHRDHINRALDAIRSQLFALQHASGIYWSTTYDPNTSPGQEAEIDYLIQDISALCAACAPHLWGSRDQDGPTLIADLAAAATAHPFGTRERTAQPARAREVAARAAQLVRRLTLDRSRFFAEQGLLRWIGRKYFETRIQLARLYVWRRGQ